MARKATISINLTELATDVCQTEVKLEGGAKWNVASLADALRARNAEDVSAYDMYLGILQIALQEIVLSMQTSKGLANVLKIVNSLHEERVDPVFEQQLAELKEMLN